MKKLLGAALLLTLGVTSTAALAACDSCGSSNKDAETAKSVIQSVVDLYGKDAAETPYDYDVFGQVRVDGEIYTVDWSVSAVSSEVNDISDYVKVSDMDENTKLVTVSITPSDKVIEIQAYCKCDRRQSNRNPRV